MPESVYESPGLLQSELSRRIARTLLNGGDRHALMFKDQWYTWAEMDHLAGDLVRGLDEKAPNVNRIGLIVKNHPSAMGAILGLIASGRTVVMINGLQGPERLATEVEALSLAVVVGVPDFWSDAVVAACLKVGSTQVILPDDSRGSIAWHEAPTPIGTAANGEPSVALELLSSGTTGAPKRISILWRTLGAALMAAHGTVMFGKTDDDFADPSMPPVISGLSIGNIGGVYILLPSALIGQRIVMLEKFEVWPWAEAVKTYRPELLSVQPVGLRMILDAGVDPSYLDSLKHVVSGASPLDPDVQEEFERLYDLRVLGAYGATEFCGSVVVWNDDLWERFRTLKRGSVGRPIEGAQVRIVDAESRQVLPPHATGLLEVQVDRVGPEWIITTDCGYFDEDGFLFIVGRADNAINRGGFKVIPDEVVAVLRTHPSVRDASVVALPDRRLGELPVAAVELRAGASTPTEDELKEHVRHHMLSYQVPAQIIVVPDLPRNASLKVMQPQVKELFQQVDQ